MKRMIALTVVALATMVMVGCNKPQNPQPPAPVAPPQAAVSDMTSESPPPSTLAPEAPRPMSPAVGATPNSGMMPSAGGAKTYTVQAHDTLYSISVKFYGNGKKVKEIADMNGITDPNKISSGMVLKLP